MHYFIIFYTDTPVKITKQIVFNFELLEFSFEFLILSFELLVHLIRIFTKQ